MEFWYRVKYEIKEGLWIGLRYLFALIVWIAPGYYLGTKLYIVAAQAARGNSAYQFLEKDENWKILEKIAHDNRPEIRVEDKK